MNAKHTPGPWSMLPEEVDRDYIRIRGTVLGGRYKIANVITPTYEGMLEKEANETRANAKLIAAAPELLLTLQGIAADCRRGAHKLGMTCDGVSDIAARCDSAITKAAGDA